MAYTWDEVRLAVEHEESARLDEELAEHEVKEGHVPTGDFVLRRRRPMLEIAGAIVCGLNVAIMAITMNFLLFIWILHVNFDF
jgi:hypothetical protein